jgi:hypothetical protein
VERERLTWKLGGSKKKSMRIKKQKEIAGERGAYKIILKRWGKGC